MRDIYKKEPWLRPKPGEPMTRREWIAFQAKGPFSPLGGYLGPWPFSLPRIHVLWRKQGSVLYRRRTNHIRRTLGLPLIRKKDWTVI